LKTGRAEFRGTTLYASPFSHHGFHQCPRDDLLGVMHVFIDMVCGQLAWGPEARLKDKQRVIEIKDECYSDIRKWLATQAKSVETLENNVVSAQHHNLSLSVSVSIKSIYLFLSFFLFVSFRFFLFLRALTCTHGHACMHACIHLNQGSIEHNFPQLTQDKIGQCLEYLYVSDHCC
jgi:hypothetical protein